MLYASYQHLLFLNKKTVKYRDIMEVNQYVRRIILELSNLESLIVLLCWSEL